MRRLFRETTNRLSGLASKKRTAKEVHLVRSSKSTGERPLGQPIQAIKIRQHSFAEKGQADTETEYSLIPWNTGSFAKHGASKDRR